MHRTRVHDSPCSIAAKVTCSLCGKKFMSKSLLSLHHTQAHYSGKVSNVSNNSQQYSYKQQRYSVLSSLEDDIPAAVEVGDSSCEEPPKKKSAKSTQSSQTKHSTTAVQKKTTDKNATSFPAANQRCNDCGKLFVNLANHKQCSKKLVSEAQLSAAHAEQNTVITRARTRTAGSTRKQHTKMRLETELKELKKNCLKKKADNEKDPLLERLTEYHNQLLSEVDNILTEKVSAEVKDVVNDLSQIDDVRRPFRWSKADEQRLNELNAEAKRLRTPENWTWAAKEGTDQYEYNHKRLQYFVQHELETVVKHCSKCKSTGILVGVDQIDSAYCYDCMILHSSTRSEKVKSDKQTAWESVRPKSMSYPQTIAPRNKPSDHINKDLPLLYPGDKAVLSPVHPVVTVRKNYFANKKLRQESITLMQDPQQTWCKVLPRTDLTDRFVVIERTSKNHTRKHIVANPASVQAWLRFLFKNHPDFIKMERDGELELSEQALSVLQSQSELGEVLDDVEYVSETDDKDDNSCHRAMPSGMSSSGILQPELESGFCRTDVFTFDKFPHLYLKAKDFLRIKQAGEIEIIEDHQRRVPIYNVSATVAFPYLYPRGEKSPLDFGDYKMSRYLLKKQTLFAYKMSDAKYKWEYAEDDTHLMFQYARLVELMINARMTWYLQQSPDVAHLPMDDVIRVFKEGFSGDESIIDSKMPGLSSLMMQLPNSREKWFSERLSIEAMSRDFGDPNLFLTISNDPRSTYDTRALLYQLEHGEQMPADHPYEMDTQRFTDLMSRFAPQMSIYLCRKTKMFLKAFLCDICGIAEKEPTGDWTKRDRVAEGYYWARVEYTESRGIQHWHCLCKLPSVLDTALLGRMCQNMRVVRQEIKCGNIKPGKEAAAWQIVEAGLLASRYVTLFADSISTASFYTEHMDVDCHDPSKVIDVDKLRQQFIQNYKQDNISMTTHPLMRRFCDVEYCDENTYVEMAKVASVSCVHNCIQTVCGGDEKTGKGCRFDFPKKNLNHTVPAIMQVNATQCEARILMRRTCGRVPNLNSLFLLYLRTNHDVSVLIDGAHKMRYACKYAAKSGRYNELLNEIIEYLSQRSMDLIPTNMKHVLSQLLLADVSHRAFMSKQELSYHVMDLPVVRKTFANVDVVGFYRRSYLTLKTGDDRTIVYSDRTEYSAYAERCSPKTVIVNRKNTTAEKRLTTDAVANMCFREFAETVRHEWQRDAAEPIEQGSSRRMMSRDVDSGHWVLKLRDKRRHIRFSTVLYTDMACQYDPVEFADSTTFFSLPVNKRKQLYRAYMELVCYVPWVGSPEESFLDDVQRSTLEDEWQDPERDQRYSLRRLEMFLQAYMKRWNNGEVAPIGSQWRRDNQYSYSMFLTTQHNVDIHHQRVENDGMLKARYEADDELREHDVDVRLELQDEVDRLEYPCALNFLPPDTFRELMEQKPPELSEVSVAYPTQASWRQMENLVSEEKSKLFMAQPPSCSVTYEDMTDVQRWAVDLGVDMSHQILYLCGKAGSGKTQVALKICEMLSGRIQAAAVTGKAASLLGAPTVHGMFGWGMQSQNDGSSTLSARKSSELRSFYANTDVFLIDEVNAMSAAMLAKMHQVMTTLFNPTNFKGADGELLPFGGKKVIFLGDPAQLKPVMGEAIYSEGTATSTKPARVRKCRGKRQMQYTLAGTGQELYRKYLVGNCVLLNRGQRSSGLLQQICDRLRDGKQTPDDLHKLTCRRRKFPTFMTDYTLHYDNESCSFTNMRQLWSECSEASPTKRMYICKASYHTTNENHSVVDGLAALPPKKFGFAADVLCVSVGCDVRLIKNMDVAAGLVNSATGTVVNIIYDNADCEGLLAGKNPPPYCIVVNFAGFRGFVMKGGHRVYPLPNQPHWVPIYRQRFTALRSDLPSWIIKKQEVKHCYRIQFPLDLCRAMTCHRAQGQTLSDCTVSVDVGLSNPDSQLPQDISSILYVACTRVPQLCDLFVSSIYPNLWEQIGKTTADVERHKVDEKLRKAALEFASQQGKYREMVTELDWKPDYSNCDNEWLCLQDGSRAPMARETLNVEASENDWLANSRIGQFTMCVKPVFSERHIGIDQGCRNFAMVAVDKLISKPPVVVAAENFDLQLKDRFTVLDVLMKLVQETELMSWMQQSNDTTQIQRELPVVDRVVIHIEQMSIFNPNWKQFGARLGEELQKLVTDVNRCIVKLSSPHLFRSGGIMHHLGEEIVSELKLVPVSFDNKLKSSTVLQCSRQLRFDDVEPSSSSESDNEADCEKSSVVDADYRRRKKMSADIFRYLMHADEDRQTTMGVNVVPEVQDLWRDRMERNPRIKLDDVGDALLHGLNDILCGGSNYRQLVPSNVALHCNRTVVIAVCPDYTYWCVIYCTWNIFTVENLGYYMHLFNSRYYNADQTVTDIKKSLLDNLGTALTDMSGGETYQNVDVIKMVVKQLKGFGTFKRRHAGALTKSAVTALKQICDEAAGSNSLLDDRKDKFIGSVYMRTNPTTSHKFQVVISAGKLTNAILSCFNWMSENAKTFVERRTFSIDERTKLCFFDALYTVATSKIDNLELIKLSDYLKQTLPVEGFWYTERVKKMLGYLILIGISKNEQHIKAIASNYRRSAGHHPKQGTSRSASGEVS